MNRPHFAALTTLTLVLGTARAQCPTTTHLFDASSITPRGALIDVGYNWDPDGAGPAGPLFAFGGFFELAECTGAQSVATYDPATGAFSALGSGLFHEVDALTGLPNGNLVAGGGAAGLSGSVDVWNGVSWGNIAAPLSTNGYVWSLTTLPNGDVVAGGDFTMIDSVAANRIARWNGASWSPLGAGFDGRVLSLNVSPSGSLIASGWFTSSGGVLMDGGIAEWNGTSWVSLNPGTTLVPIQITVAQQQTSGDILAGGAFFDPAMGAPVLVARWTASSGWQPLGAGPDGPVVAITALPNGNVIAGGAFTAAGGVPANNVACWDGVSWSAIGGGFGAGSPHQVISLTTLPNGDVMAGGAFDTKSFVTPSGIFPPRRNLGLIANGGGSVVDGCLGQPPIELSARPSAASGFTVTCPTLSGCMSSTVMMFGPCSPQPIVLPPALGCGSCGLVVFPALGNIVGPLAIPPLIAPVGLQLNLQCACIAGSCVQVSPAVSVVVER